MEPRTNSTINRSSNNSSGSKSNVPTLRVGLLFLDPDELLEDLLIVEFDLDCII